MAFQKIKSNDTYTGQNELNIINAGTYLEGSLETKGSVQINGKVKGMVRAADEVRVGRSGEIVGEVYAKSARIAGKIEGNVFIEQKLTLEETSSLNGNLAAGKLIIDEGAVFNGKSDMSKKGQPVPNNGKGILNKTSIGKEAAQESQKDNA